MISFVKIEFMAELLYWIASPIEVYLIKWQVSVYANIRLRKTNMSLIFFYCDLIWVLTVVLD